MQRNEMDQELKIIPLFGETQLIDLPYPFTGDLYF
jgi:hypothetical protein